MKWEIRGPMSWVFWRHLISLWEETWRYNCRFAFFICCVRFCGRRAQVGDGSLWGSIPLCSPVPQLPAIPARGHLRCSCVLSIVNSASVRASLWINLSQGALWWPGCEGSGICTLMADPHCWTSWEMNTTQYTSYPPIYFLKAYGVIFFLNCTVFIVRTECQRC